MAKTDTHGKTTGGYSMDQVVIHTYVLTDRGCREHTVATPHYAIESYHADKRCPVCHMSRADHTGATLEGYQYVTVMHSDLDHSLYDRVHR